MLGVFFSAHTLSVTVESKVYKQFCKNISPLRPEEALQSIIYTIANGDLKIKKCGDQPPKEEK